MSTAVRIRTSLAVLSCAWFAFAARAEDWPAVPAPPGARVQRVADDMVLNGRQCRVYRFQLSGTEQDLLRFYRQQFGPHRVENRIDGAQIVATRRGDYFQTVQLRSVGAGQVQATVMTTALRADSQDSVPSLATQELLPPATALLSTIQSQDGEKRSTMVLGANRNGTRANRDHIVSALQARGFRLVSESAATVGGRAVINLVMASSGEEAIVSVSDAGAYRSLVINRTRERK